MIQSLLLCLTLTIYHEARGEPTEVQEAVAAVTMNRTREKEYPRDVCRVVHAPGAYSWVGKRKTIKEKEAFKKAQSIAKIYLKGKINNKIGRRLFFNHHRLGKRWKTPNRPIRIGQFLVY
jgi:spore germination cell wall hydrolase CwlJ-like protein